METIFKKARVFTRPRCAWNRKPSCYESEIQTKYSDMATKKGGVEIWRNNIKKLLDQQKQLNQLMWVAEPSSNNYNYEKQYSRRTKFEDRPTSKFV